MKPRTLLVLFVLVAGLGAFIWFHERKLPGSEERTEQGKKVLRLEAKEVQALTLEAGSKKLRLEREAEPAGAKEGEQNEDEPPAFPPPARWRLTEPLAAAADGAEVNRLLDSLLGLDKQRTLEDIDPAELGLAKPRGKVTFETAKGTKVLAIGAQLPQSDSMIVTVEGSKEAFVVSSFVYNDLDKEAGDWRDKSLFRGERTDIQSVRLTPRGVPPAAGTSILLAKRGEELWLESPIADRADREATDKLLAQISTLKATRFVDGPPAPDFTGAPVDLGLSPPAGVIEVVLQGGAEPLRIELGAPIEEGSLSRFARVGGQLVETDADLMPLLDKAPESWRSLAWTSFDSWAVDGAIVEDPQGKLELVRDSGEWKRDGVEVPYTPVGDLLAALSEARAERVAPPEASSALGAKSPLTITLKGREERTETLGLYPAIDGDSPATVSGRQAVLLLPAKVVEDLQVKIAAVRAAQPVPKEEGEEEGDAGVEVEKEEGPDQ